VSHHCFSIFRQALVHHEDPWLILRFDVRSLQRATHHSALARVANTEPLRTGLREHRSAQRGSVPIGISLDDSKDVHLLGHGLRWSEYSTVERADEERQLHDAIALYRKLTGQRPLGWNCRSFPSVNTRDLIVKEGGFLYYSDPCNDDLPYFIDHDGTRLLVVPYSKTLNDSRYLIAPGYSNPRDFAEDCRSAIDYMISEAEETGGRMLTIGVHARWMGQPNRASGLRDVIEHVQKTPGAAFMRREDIARHWLDNHETFNRDA